MATFNKMEYDNGFALTFSETVSGGSTSSWLLIPNNIVTVGVTVIPGTSAKVQYTRSSVEDIESGNEVILTWPLYEVSNKTTDDFEGPVTAMRLVAVSGNATWEVIV